MHRNLVILTQVCYTHAKSRVLLHLLPLLQEAVLWEDALGYMEPPRITAPVRPCLGWALTQQGHLTEAKAVFQEDLEQHPGNGWSLLGLLQVFEQLSKQGSSDVNLDVKEVQQRHKAAWQYAEVNLTSPCPALARTWPTG